MSSASEKRVRAEAVLGELAELGLMLARDLAVQARAAEDAQEKVALAAAFQKTSRAVRLTLALDFQLERQAARAEREAELQAREDVAFQERTAHMADQGDEPAEPAPAERQKTRVRGVLNRLLWTEAEGDPQEFDILREDLDARLDEAAEAEGFADLPIEAVAQRLKADMQIEGALVVTTARSLAAANAAQLPLADTG